MTIAFAIVVVVHGLIHLLGVAKAFGLADLPQLTQPVAPAMGVLWLIAAGLFLATAGSLFLWPRGWWALGAAAVVVSTIAIVPSWTDAKAGALVNLVVLAGVVIGFLAEGPVSLRASYDRQVDRGFADAAPAAPAGSITEADLAPLPVPVQRYLRVAGVVGQAPVRNFRARMHGRIRSGPDAPWMPFTAEQYNFYDPPARLFFMDARRGPIPFQAFHRYVGSAATMRVTVAALASVVNASGPEMTGAETVTLFNDMCVFAPATLVDPAVTWEAGDARTARAAFTHAGHTIRAELAFDEAGELADFWSDDRLQVSPDGATLTRMRWSTPLGAYRPFGSIRLASYGEGRWRGPDAEYTYIELHIDDVQYNVRRR
jgi:Family of unknown function (DUF6544)